MLFGRHTNVDECDGRAFTRQFDFRCHSLEVRVLGLLGEHERDTRFAEEELDKEQFRGVARDAGFFEGDNEADIVALAVCTQPSQHLSSLEHQLLTLSEHGTDFDGFFFRLGTTGSLLVLERCLTAATEKQDTGLLHISFVMS